MSSVIYDSTRRSGKERAFHALLFEVIATLITAPTAAWLMGHSIIKMGALTIMFAAIAALCNVVFNFLFDLAQRRMCFKRTVKVRLLHATLFEISLIGVLVPVAAWWLSVGWVEAFLLDIGFTLFFLPYTFVYNYVYDEIREYLFKRKMMKQQLDIKVLP
ncbi:multidrug/biocide efflux PACE transporter [Entomomonas sp. E2T0]|nr:multidrug/biocide efflux PACE transporter [Entomomonas sp. E2T0]UYZ85586.1 multidrug/biocide efflux PACE transporter [Entomomonas sp. E2T0]